MGSVILCHEPPEGFPSGLFFIGGRYMKCKILHENKGRMRVRFCIRRMTLRQADITEYALSAVS